jgi:RHS repeat-associated protein
MEKNGASFFYHSDALSSITELTDHSGTVAQRYSYLSFGRIEQQGHLNVVQPYAYTSREFDLETELYYYRARFYDVLTGRFLQEDPIGISGGLNVYTYVNDNPVGAIDPFGLDAIDMAANAAAGFGDVVSFGLTNWVRNRLALNDIINECSWSYSSGKWIGWLHGLGFSGVGLFSGGAKTVLWSGGEAARTAARSAGGRMLEDTAGGKLLNFVNDNLVTVPQSVWKGASGVFSANAKGDVQVFLNESRTGGVFHTVERPILDFVNRVHTAVTGSPASVIVPR